MQASYAVHLLTEALSTIRKDSDSGKCERLWQMKGLGRQDAGQLGTYYMA